MVAVNEWRTCHVTCRRVVIAGERGGRPGAAATRAPFEPIERCPFCEGNEHDTPATIVQRSLGIGHSWDIRVVSNRFPAVTYATVSGAGAHEVVIESAEHVAAFHELPERQLELALFVWRDRLAALRRSGFAYAWAFKNSGTQAGASLEHVHSQIVGLDFVPDAVGLEWKRSTRLWKERGNTFAGEVISRERREGARIVADGDHFIVICPRVSRFGYEMAIAPFQASPHFEACDRIGELSGMLRRTLASLARATGGCDYNLVLQQAPFAATDAAMGWRLEVLPRLSREAGFEWATGCHINTIPPERAAAEIRANWA